MCSFLAFHAMPASQPLCPCGIQDSNANRITYNQKTLRLLVLAQ